MRCTNCGHEEPIAAARFCTNCGVPLPENPQPSQPAQPVQPEPAYEPIQPEPTYEPSPSYEPSQPEEDPEDSVAFMAGEAIGGAAAKAKAAFNSNINVQMGANAGGVAKPKFGLIAIVAVLIGICIFFATSSGILGGGIGSMLADNSNKVKLELDIECDENLFFSRYDVRIKIDGKEVGTIDHGATDMFTAYLEPGDHTIKFNEQYNAKVNGSRNFTLGDEDSILTCKIECKSDLVKIKSFSITTTSEVRGEQADDKAEA